MLDIKIIQKETAKLLSNPLLADKPIRSIAQLRVFMEHHVFAVWDFMCLAKSLQHSIAPSCDIWLPPKDQLSARLINEIITVEETDYTLNRQSYCSHFELYIQAMIEVGADTGPIKTFINNVRSNGVEYALENSSIPRPARDFVDTTITFISKNKPWVTCAAFLFGRESLIPEMFQELVSNKVVSPLACPAFDYYLKRHIEVDGGSDEESGHSKMGNLMLDSLCAQNPIRYEEVKNTAIHALRARDILWHSVFSLIKPSDLKCA